VCAGVCVCVLCVCAGVCVCVLCVCAGVCVCVLCVCDCELERHSVVQSKEIIQPAVRAIFEKKCHAKDIDRLSISCNMT